MNKFKLDELVGKFIRIEFIDSDKELGKLEGIDKDLNVIIVYMRSSNDRSFIPLSSVKSITEAYT